MQAQAGKKMHEKKSRRSYIYWILLSNCRCVIGQPSWIQCSIVWHLLECLETWSVMLLLLCMCVCVCRAHFLSSKQLPSPSFGSNRRTRWVDNSCIIWYKHNYLYEVRPRPPLHVDNNTILTTVTSVEIQHHKNV